MPSYDGSEPFHWESRGILGGWRSNHGAFVIQKRGSLPSMIAWDLYNGGERVRAFRTLREAKAKANELAQEEVATTREP